MRRTLTVLAALAVTAVAAPAVATQPDPDPIVTVEVAWAMTPPAGGWLAPPTNVTATWPQYLATGLECESWTQVDTYTARQSVIDAILADGRLDRGEDSRVVVSWRFVQQPACEPEPPIDPPVDPPTDPPVPPTAPPATPAPKPVDYAG